jgi:hypothetical protein
MVEMEVEVVDVPIDYNLFLGHNWTYAMVTVVSSVFHTICFPHDRKIATINQLSFAYASPNASVGSPILVIENSQLETKNIIVEMYSFLVVTFEFMESIHHVDTMSSRPVSIERSIPFHTSYFSDPWRHRS